MVQNNGSAPTRRGRPRAYNPQTALQLATDRFWRGGYSGTSLDQLCAETGMNRPSLYAAFGDKHTLYLKALEGYWQLSLKAIREALADDGKPLKEALLRAYDAQLAIYFAGDESPRGCFVIGTAITEAVEDVEIRNSLAAGLAMLDADFEVRLQVAHERGELQAGADPTALATLASAVLHTIAIRARAGIPRVELREIARKAVNVICGLQS
ncbi:MAG: TetR/AcrR family transcriptional regulator [Acidocella sp.]|nr:TetR/AcrR family transcriptional regulator [Acidocella sp.]